MTFNRGFFCSNCGPIEKSSKNTIKKVQYDTCPACSLIVKKWERPLNERKGRCPNCAHGGFKLGMKKGVMLRKCLKCGEITNPDTKEIVKEGDKKNESNDS
jgi:DNA-directed RNA polymerase subunit RPC12/RpoP